MRDVTGRIDAIRVRRDPIDPFPLDTEPPVRPFPRPFPFPTGEEVPEPSYPGNSEPLAERGVLTVPVSPTDPFGPATVFESAGDPSARSYLPSYTIRYETVRFRQTATGFELTMVLGPSAPPDPTALPVVAPVTAELTYQLPGSAARQALRFTEVVQEQDGLRIRATSTRPDERTATYWALTDPDAGARLTISRSVTAAVPVTVHHDGHPLPIDPVLMLAHKRMRWLDSDPLTLTALPAPPTRTVTMYRVVTAAFDEVAHPDRAVLFFSPQVDAQVFVGVTGVGTPLVQLVPHNVGGHVYFQRAPGSPTFYALPDELRLGRAAAPPHAPLLQIAFGDEDGVLDAMADVDVDVRFAVLPWTDPARLSGALAPLRRLAPPPYVEGVQDVEVLPLSLASDRLTLTLRLGAAGAGSAVAAHVTELSLTRAFECQVTVPVTGFRQAFVALHAGGSALFAGSMEVRVDQEGLAYRVPFPGRLDQAVCGAPLVELADVATGPGGELNARLLNPLESPVRVRSLSLDLRHGPAGVAVPASHDLALPVDVPAGGAVAFVARAAAATDPGAPAVLSVSSSEVDVRIDADAFYDTTLDPGVAPAFVRQLRVLVSAALFDDPALEVLQVAFSAGDGVNILRPDPAHAARFVESPSRATVAVPIKSWLLSQGELPTDVEYRVRPIRAGAQATFSAPVMDEAVGGDVFVVSLPAPAPGTA